MPWYIYGGETLQGRLDAIQRFGDDVIRKLGD
jgi:hypothetical protein